MATASVSLTHDVDNARGKERHRLKSMHGVEVEWISHLYIELNGEICTDDVKRILCFSGVESNI